jgi:hypothetical protein
MSVLDRHQHIFWVVFQRKIFLNIPDIPYNTMLNSDLTKHNETCRK